MISVTIIWKYERQFNFLAANSDRTQYGYSSQAVSQFNPVIGGRAAVHRFMNTIGMGRIQAVSDSLSAMVYRKPLRVLHHDLQISISVVSQCERCGKRLAHI